METGESETSAVAESVGQVIFDCMKKWRGNIGQIAADIGKKETFGDMFRKTIRTAIKMQSIGIGRGDMISTCSHNHENSCIPELAAFLVGAIPSTFDPNLPELDTISLLRLIQPKIMFVSLRSLNFIETCISKAKVSTQIVLFETKDNYSSFEEYLTPSPNEESFTPIKIKNAKETAVILFSSGTTGNPKGICLSHYTLLNPYFFEGIKKHLSGSESVFLNYTTLYWVSGLMFLLESIFTGTSRVICAQFDPPEFWSIVGKYKVELVFMAPHQVVDLLSCKPPKPDTSSMKVILISGSVLAKHFKEDFAAAFPSAFVLNVYGMTEIGGLICIFDPSSPEKVELQCRKPKSVGMVMRFIDWKVVDPETEKVLGPYEDGEMRLKTDRYMNGYYQLDSSDAFDSDGYLKTGDVVYYDEDYCFYIKERIKDMFKYRGWHIVPSIVEEVLLKHPAVQDAALLGIPHVEDGHHPMAVVALKDDCLQTDAQEILDFVNVQVSEVQKLRAGIRILEGKLPRTVTGKLKRRVLKEMILKDMI